MFPFLSCQGLLRRFLFNCAPFLQWLKLFPHSAPQGLCKRPHVSRACLLHFQLENDFSFSFRNIVILSVGMINGRGNTVFLGLKSECPEYLPRGGAGPFLPPFLCQWCSPPWGDGLAWGRAWLVFLGLFFPRSGCCPSHLIFLVPMCFWVSKAAEMVEEKVWG